MKHLTLLSLLAVLLTPVFAQHHENKYVPETDPLVLQKLEQWQDLKFGLLMHWGAYSQWGIVESWSICAEDEGWCRRKNDNYEAYKKEYENLQNTFNPEKFNPGKWAGAAKEAGMKYVVFTTKHHDGFCMFDSQETDYKITNQKCPFSTHPKANITKEIFSAFRKKGLWTGAYFSKPDWHCPSYWWPNFATPDRHVNYRIEAYPKKWEEYVNFTHNQIDELMSDYGKVDILWLDGGWVRPLSREDIFKYISDPNYKFTHIQSQDIRMDEIVEKARIKQPGLIVVDRAVPGKNQNYLTPENRVPDKALPYPWESCIISGGGWSWVPNAKYMSGRKAIHLLVDIVAKGGNLLLNIAPGPDGRWDDGAYKLLEEYADWMQVNQEAIYATRAIEPYKEGKICLTQAKNQKALYAIYLAEAEETQIPEHCLLTQINIPAHSKISLLGNPTPLEWKQVNRGFMINIPEKIQKHPPCKYAWAFKIEFPEK